MEKLSPPLRSSNSEFSKDDTMANVSVPFHEDCCRLWGYKQVLRIILHAPHRSSTFSAPGTTLYIKLKKRDKLPTFRNEQDLGSFITPKVSPKIRPTSMSDLVE
jgi:hypothetical protein